MHRLIIRHIGLLTIFLCCSYSIAYSQTYFEAGGRNHPELNWVVSETENFKIIYPSHLDGIQDHAAAIAEETYLALTANLGYTLDKKIRIYLSDHDEIPNGFAVPLADPYTNIWVNVNEYAMIWTGEAKWLRKVISHELAHIFHFEAVRSTISPFEVLFANPLPRFWTEGFAQYQTELWDTRRGDRWLRIAAFEDRLNYSDGESAWNSTLMYALGNSQVRYFADQYGDTALAKLHKHRKPTLLGLAKVHDFDAAMRATINKSYDEFNEEWKKHIGVYYNTLAGQMDRIDSMKATRMQLPATWYQDIKYSRDTSKIAVLGLASLERPLNGIFTISNDSVRKTRILATGSINTPISWHPEGEGIVYSRRTRGTGGAIVNDLYYVDYSSGSIDRLTHDKRARSPVYSPNGNRIAYIQSQGKTDNIVLLEIETGKEEQVTWFNGDTQLLSIQWHPTEELILLSRFSDEQIRDIILLDLVKNTITPLTNGEYDDRFPIWKPDGTAFAYTSLRDHIENIFIQPFNYPGEPIRVTNLFTGAYARDWLPSDSLHPNGQLVIQTTETKRGDQVYLIDAEIQRQATTRTLPSEYAEWVTHRPPNEIPKHIIPDASLILEQYTYPSFSNLTHTLTLAAPYYAGTLLGEYEYGIAAGTAWIEPIGKHILLAGGGISFTDVLRKSFFFISYTNNQLRPSIRFDVFKRKPSARTYGRDLLLQERNGAEVTITQPLDWLDTPYTSSEIQLRVRYAHRNIYNPDSFIEMPFNLPSPVEGNQADLRFTYTIKRQLPKRSNVIQQLEGWGLRIRLAGALPGPFTDSSYFRPDLAAYTILPGLGKSRFYVYFRALGMYGNPFPQDFIGLTRNDYITVPFEDPLGLFALPENERVRGYSDFLIGDQLLFGTVEYRVPFFNLRTMVLGTALLGQTSFSPFLDVGSLINTQYDQENFHRAGVGMELKNVLQIGRLRLLHSLGIGQPTTHIGIKEGYDLFYRIRASVPF